jgi:hypothetical protein
MRVYVCRKRREGRVGCLESGVCECKRAGSCVCIKMKEIEKENPQRQDCDCLFAVCLCHTLFVMLLLCVLASARVPFLSRSRRVAFTQRRFYYYYYPNRKLHVIPLLAPSSSHVSLSLLPSPPPLPPSSQSFIQSPIPPSLPPSLPS